MQQQAEVVQRELGRDRRRAGQRRVRVEGGRDDVDDREERDHDRDDRDEVAPPVAGEQRPPGRGRLGDGGDAERGGLRGLVEGAHRTLSSAFVRQKLSPEIVATMKKMMIAIVLASA